MKETYNSKFKAQQLEKQQVNHIVATRIKELQSNLFDSHTFVLDGETCNTSKMLFNYGLIPYNIDCPNRCKKTYKKIINTCPFIRCENVSAEDYLKKVDYSYDTVYYDGMSYLKTCLPTISIFFEKQILNNNSVFVLTLYIGKRNKKYLKWSEQHLNNLSMTAKQNGYAICEFHEPIKTNKNIITYFYRVNKLI